MKHKDITLRPKRTTITSDERALVSCLVSLFILWLALVSISVVDLWRLAGG